MPAQHQAWDLDQLAGRYRAFLTRWRVPAQAPDSLARHLLLESDWLQTIRDDPRLPRVHLPADWPAEPAEELFHSLSDTLAPEARAIVAEVLDTIPDTQAASDPASRA